MNKVSIGFTGDFCPWARMETAWKDGSWKEKLGDVLPFFEQNDFNVIDLECPLTTSNKVIPKTGPHIKSLPETATMLNYLNCAVVATANNHFKDYDWEGMQESYQALKDHRISWLGSGANLEKASAILMKECMGLKIALINMAESEWSTTDGEQAGCNPINFPGALLKIQEAKANEADSIIIILHGGHEHNPLPSPRMKAQFRFMIDAGADAVVGHHTHIVSGYEVYRGKPIFYSLGNFCFDWPGLRNGTWNRGMILRFIISEDRSIAFEYEFVLQNDAEVGVQFMKEPEKIRMEAEVQRLSGIISDDHSLAGYFEAYCAKLNPVMLSRIQPYRNKYLLALHKRGYLPDLMGKTKQQMLQILVQCESHREVLLAALKKKD